MRVTREEMAKKYRQKLTEQVKAVGQELIDRADDLVGNGGAISDFAIMLYRWNPQEPFSSVETKKDGLDKVHP